MLLEEGLKALLIGIVEGITEWLPISSTGHMILVDEFVKLQVSDEFLSMFLVVIQIAAILAVIILYFNKLNPFAGSKSREQKSQTWHLWKMVVVGCIPAAVIGLLFSDFFDEHFYNKVVVASMLIIYGIIFIIIENNNKARISKQRDILLSSAGSLGLRESEIQDKIEQKMYKVNDITQVDWKTALKIGCFQVLAIIPGTSRSGAIIVGGMLCSCSRKAIAEFAFFLAIPVMLGWGGLKIIKFAIGGLALTQTEIVVMLVGFLSAFVMSIFAIKFLISYIKSHDFKIFGWYRIVIGALVLIYFALEVNGLVS